MMTRSVTTTQNTTMKSSSSSSPILHHFVFFLLVVLASATSLATALDVEITNVSCDPNYAITATVFMTCLNHEDGSKSSRCTFGTAVGLLGQIYFAGLNQTNVVLNNNIAGVYGTLYGPNGHAISDFADEYEIDVCDESIFIPTDEDSINNGNGGYGGNGDGNDDDGNNNNDYDDDDGNILVCPADGTYTWSSAFVLPNATKYVNDFWASGWEPYATVQFEDGADNLIGDCKISLLTFASGSSSNSNSGENGSGQSENNPMSQKIMEHITGRTAVNIIKVLLGVVALMALYCYWKITKMMKKKKMTGDDEITIMNKETEFTRMDDGDDNNKPAVVVSREQPISKSGVGGPSWTVV